MKPGWWFWAVFCAQFWGFVNVAYAPPPPPPSTPIVITESRTLNFGACDLVSGATYTIDAADNPGVTGCTGSSSGRFDVTGEPGAKVVISLPVTVDVTNGTDVLSVKLSQSPTGGNIAFSNPGGTLTIFVGAQFKLVGGLPSSGDYSGPGTLSVTYK